jgi:hypothetical protein
VVFWVVRLVVKGKKVTTSLGSAKIDRRRIRIMSILYNLLRRVFSDFFEPNYDIFVT